MISSTGMVLKNGMKAVNMREDIPWERRKEWESTHGLMDLPTMANGLTIG